MGPGAKGQVSNVPKIDRIKKKKKSCLKNEPSKSVDTLSSSKLVTVLFHRAKGLCKLIEIRDAETCMVA